MVTVLMNRFVPIGIAAFLCLVPTGCQSPQPKHRMAEPETGTKIACRKRPLGR